MDLYGHKTIIVSIVEWHLFFSLSFSLYLFSQSWQEVEIPQSSSSFFPLHHHLSRPCTGRSCKILNRSRYYILFNQLSNQIEMLFNCFFVLQFIIFYLPSSSMIVIIRILFLQEKHYLLSFSFFSFTLFFQFNWWQSNCMMFVE